jgi:hypothetical protein
MKSRRKTNFNFPVVADILRKSASDSRYARCKDTLYSCMSRCFVVIFTMQFYGLFLFYRLSEKRTLKQTECDLKSPLKKQRCNLNIGLLAA